MSKDEFIKKCRNKASTPGYIMAPMIVFEILKDNVPEEYIDIFVYKPQMSKSFQLTCGPILTEALNDATNDYYKYNK